MNISRTQLIQELEHFAAGGHGLIVGLPGVGKSHSVVALHDRWTRRDVPNLVVPVDRLGTATADEIRAGLEIDVDIVELLSREMRGRTGFVVFDGFDSARNDTARTNILALVRRAIDASGGRWNVLVTVRLYDAERSQSLRDLFRAASSRPPFKGVGLDGTRHHVIPRLTESELSTAVDSVRGLRPVYEAASEGFRELLRIPFNLWLVQAILESSTDSGKLSSAASAVQLLGFYWKRRVFGGDNTEGVRKLLHTVVARMVAERALTLRRDELYSELSAGAWQEAFSAGILEEVGTQKQRCAFAHNILFDYAVSALLLDDEPKTLRQFVVGDPARPFFLRPSFVYHFTRLWYDDRAVFWTCAFAALEDADTNVALLGRVIPPGVVVMEARESKDLDPVFDAIETNADRGRDFMRRLYQALRALPLRNAGLWARVSARAAGEPFRDYLWDVVVTSDACLDACSTSGEDVRTNVGRTGRLALVWALTERREGRGEGFANALGALWAVKLTTKTFDTDAAESERLIREVVEMAAEPGFPIDYLRQVSDSVPSLLPHAPGLVADIYRVVFTHARESDEETAFGTPILPMRSTRRQDFGMCEYILAKEFHRFLAACPSEASKAALESVSQRIVSEDVQPFLREGRGLSDLAFTVRFRGVTSTSVSDYGSIWLDSPVHDDAVGLLHRVIQDLKAAGTAGDEARRDAILDAFAEKARAKGAWVSLVRAGAEVPDSVGSKLEALAAVDQLLDANAAEVTSLIQSSFLHWSEDGRERCLDAIERFYDRLAANELGPRVADMVLSGVPQSAIVRPRLLEHLTRIQASGGAPAVRPHRGPTVSWGAYSNDDWLRDKGVDTEAGPNRALIDATNALDSANQPLRNGRPKVSDCEALTTLMTGGVVMLTTITTATAEVVELLTTQVTAAAATLARAEGDLPPDIQDQVKRVLLSSAALPLSFDEEHLNRDYSSAGWSPIPQTEAAQGLAWFALRDAAPDVLATLESLARSREPSVRFLVARELFRLRRVAPDAFWKGVSDFAEYETNRVVISGLFQTLGRLPISEASRTAKVIQAIEARGLAPQDRTAPLEEYVGLLTRLAVSAEEPWALTRLRTIATDPRVEAAVAQQMVFALLTTVTHENLASQEIRPVALRAIQCLRQFVAGSVRAAADSRSKRAPDDSAEAAYKIADEIAARLYFNSQREGSEEVLGIDQLRTYFADTRELLEDTVAFGEKEGSFLLAHTAHHIMELLHRFLRLDPPGVLRLAARTAKASKPAGYILDAMAVDEVVAIADDLLANYRSEILDGNALGDLVALLDVFANAGWPSALRVLWRLDEMFR